jgi:hypothetical protein
MRQTFTLYICSSFLNIISPHSCLHLCDQFVTLKIQSSPLFLPVFIIFFNPHAVPSFLTLQDAFIPFLKAFLHLPTSCHCFLLYSIHSYRLKSPSSLPAPITAVPLFPSAPLTLSLCISVRVKNSFLFVLCSLSFCQLNEEVTVS